MPGRLSAVSAPDELRDVLQVQKTGLLVALADEVAWRVTAMRFQVSAKGGISVLIARQEEQKAEHTKKEAP